MRKPSSWLKDLQSDTPQLGSGTFKCEPQSHRNVLNSSSQSICSSCFNSCCTCSLFFSGVKTLSWYWVKGGEGVWQKINANNESVAPKKRKSRQDAKKDKQLDLLRQIIYSMKFLNDAICSSMLLLKFFVSRDDPKTFKSDRFITIYM